MNFGFNADPDIVPDLDRFVSMMRRSLERVASEAGVKLREEAAKASQGVPAAAI
jgi:hypothetical protein